MSIDVTSLEWFSGWYIQDDFDSFQMAIKERLKTKFETNTFYNKEDSVQFNGVFFSSSRKVAQKYAEAFLHLIEHAGSFDEGVSFLASAKISTNKIFDCADVFVDRNTNVDIRSLSDLSEEGILFSNLLHEKYNLSFDEIITRIRRMRYYHHYLFNPYLQRDACFADVIKDLGYHGFFEKDPTDMEMLLEPMETPEFNPKIKLLPVAICIFNEFAPKYIHINKVDYKFTSFLDEESSTRWRNLWKAK